MQFVEEKNYRQQSNKVHKEPFLQDIFEPNHMQNTIIYNDDLIDSK